MLDQHDDEQLRTPSTCPRHPLYVGRCPLCAREHDDVGHAPAPPAPVVPALGRVVASAEHVHVAPSRFPADVASVTHCLHDVRPEQCPRCSPAPVVPARPWSEIDARHRDAIVGMLSAAAAHQIATARVQRAAHTSAERIADTEARGEAYAAAVEQLRRPVWLADVPPPVRLAGPDENVIAVELPTTDLWLTTNGADVGRVTVDGVPMALVPVDEHRRLTDEIARLEAIEMPVDAEQAFERGWDARADATLRGAGRHVATIREALMHELLRGNLATFAATYDRDAEAYDERAAACGTGPDHDRHRGNAERSRASARLFRAVLALGTTSFGDAHVPSVRPADEARQGRTETERG